MRSSDQQCALHRDLVFGTDFLVRHSRLVRGDFLKIEQRFLQWVHNWQETCLPPSAITVASSDQSTFDDRPVFFRRSCMVDCVFFPRIRNVQYREECWMNSGYATVTWCRSTEGLGEGRNWYPHVPSQEELVVLCVEVQLSLCRSFNDGFLSLITRGSCLVWMRERFHLELWAFSSKGRVAVHSFSNELWVSERFLDSNTYQWVTTNKLGGSVSMAARLLWNVGLRQVRCRCFQDTSSVKADTSCELGALRGSVCSLHTSVDPSEIFTESRVTKFVSFSNFRWTTCFLWHLNSDFFNFLRWHALGSPKLLDLFGVPGSWDLLSDSSGPWRRWASRFRVYRSILRHTAAYMRNWFHAKIVSTRVSFVWVVLRKWMVCLPSLDLTSPFENSSAKKKNMSGNAAPCSVRFVRARAIPYSFWSQSTETPMTKLELLREFGNLCCFCKTSLHIVFRPPFNVVGHRHEYHSAFWNHTVSWIPRMFDFVSWSGALCGQNTNASEIELVGPWYRTCLWMSHFRGLGCPCCFCTGAVTSYAQCRVWEYVYANSQRTPHWWL